MEALYNRLESFKKNIEKLDSIDLRKDFTIYNLNEDLSLNAKIIAVDSGFFLNKEYNLDFAFIKTAYVFMEYDGILKNYNYGINDKFLFETYENYESYLSISRLIEEIKLAKKIYFEKSADYIFLDGPLIPHPNMQQTKSSELYNLYRELISEIKSLKKLGAKLIAFVEDFKSKYFSKHYGLNINDSYILTKCLKKKEAIAFVEESFEYKVYSSYFKVDIDDYVLKIQTFDKDISCLDIAYSLSKHIKNYFYPAPIIVADMLARISDKEKQFVENYFASFFNNEDLLLKRRYRRPF